MEKGLYYVPSRSELIRNECPEQLWDSIICRLMHEKLESTEQFQIITDVRTVLAHHSELIDVRNNDILSNVLDFLTPLVSNLRSALAKNAVIACTELVLAIGEIICTLPSIGTLIDALLTRASSDKNFMREISTRALTTIFQGHKSNLALLESTLENTRSKNRQLVMHCVNISVECLINLPDDDYHLMDLISMAEKLGNVYSNKSAEARSDATKMIWMIGNKRNWEEWANAIRAICKPIIAVEMLKGTPLEKAPIITVTQRDELLPDILESPPKRMRCAGAHAASSAGFPSPIPIRDTSAATNIASLDQSKMIV